jgi:hypothetical protein
MSALPPKADIRQRVLDVRFGPLTDIRLFSFDRLVVASLGSVCFLASPPPSLPMRCA